MEYSSGESQSDPSFWRLCDKNTNKCYCDFRLTITHCEQTPGLHILNIVDIVWSAVATIIALIILYWRVKYRNQQFFDLSGKYPRPKPIESMGLFGVLFNLCRIVHACVLITDVSNNPYFRAIMFELPWQFGIQALSCYLFGVVYTLNSSTSATNQSIYKSWIKSQKTVDFICIVMMILPFATINPMAAVSAYYAKHGDTVKATIWTDALYCLWIVYTFILGGLILYAGIRLLNLLNEHLKKNGEINASINKIRLGAAKLKIIVGIGCFCLWAFTVMIILYVSARTYIITNYGFSMAIACLALFNGPLATSIIEVALLLNVNFLNGLDHISFGTSGETQTKLSKANNSRNRKESHFSEVSTQGLNTMNSSVGHTESWHHQSKDNHTNSNNQLERKNSQLGYSLSSYNMNDLRTPNSVKTVVATEDEDDSFKKITEVEEEQFYYNSMTNQVRRPPPVRHFNNNNNNNNNNQQQQQQQHPLELDGNNSISSDILDNLSLSNVHLVDPQHDRV
ncbi:unnamed protein product [Cunninghamella blakesleeana]